jgi:hypothetical protein
VDGISLVGPIPDAVQLITTFSRALRRHRSRGPTARQLIEHLASAQARETIRQTGLDPVKAPNQIAFTRVFPNAGQIGFIHRRSRRQRRTAAVRHTWFRLRRNVVA